ncbi:hypothetical protein [Pseudomonas aeruginosa]|uniref:hypothetical protein n=1 Tax=Pseudomonas aeruginosa TaxID=287 RepID=UPI003D2B466E
MRAEEETPIRVWLAEIAVLPGAQSSGVGAALLRRFAEDHRGAYLFTRRHPRYRSLLPPPRHPHPAGAGENLRDQSGT